MDKLFHLVAKTMSVRTPSIPHSLNKQFNTHCNTDCLNPSQPILRTIPCFCLGVIYTLPSSTWVRALTLSNEEFPQVEKGQSENSRAANSQRDLLGTLGSISNSLSCNLTLSARSKQLLCYLLKVWTGLVLHALPYKMLRCRTRSSRAAPVPYIRNRCALGVFLHYVF